MLLGILNPFKSHKYLLFQLIQKDIKARYKQSFVGYTWVILNPLAQLLVYTFVFSVVFRTVSVDVPYPLFVFSVLIPWTFFQTSVAAATNSLVSNSSLLKKVAFPREIIPYAAVISKVVDLIFSYVVFLLFMFVFKVPFNISGLLFFLIFPIQVIFTVAVSLFTSAANLFYRDVQYLVGLVLMLWMYLTPVVYPLTMVPEKYVHLYKLNPLVGIVEGYRAAFFGSPLDHQSLLWSAVSSAILFLFCFAFFKKVESVFGDIV